MEFSIVYGGEYCSFENPAGGYSDIVQMDANGIVNINLKLEDNFNISTTEIILKFEACGSSCYGYDKSNKPKNAGNEFLLSVDCPPAPTPEECLQWGGAVPGYTHYNALDYIPSDPTHEILLGESKYFETLNHPSDPNKIIITDANGPTLSTGALTNVEWVVSNVVGDRLGVYYEIEKPQSINPPANLLPSGLIRIIGRFYEENKEYIVKLEVNDLNSNPVRSTSILLKVVRPFQLGNSPNAIARRMALDIYGVTYNVDDICIKYGGEFGIPPQYFKAHFHKESPLINNMLYPPFRYEPWSAELWTNLAHDYEDGHFWVTENNMGSGHQVPTDHQNLRYMDYVNTPHSVWWFIEQFSKLVHNEPPGGESLFGEYSPTTGLFSFIYYKPSKEYRLIREEVYDYFSLDTEDNDPEINNTFVNTDFIEFMRDSYLGVGLDNRMAQSRIASSYSPLQLMYTTAEHNLDYGTNPENAPEYLSIPSVYWPFILSNLIRVRQEVLPANEDVYGIDWTDGHNEVFFRTYEEWNSADYAEELIDFSNLYYLPMREQQ